MLTRLDVRGFSVELPTAGGWVRPVNEVSLTFHTSQTKTIRDAVAHETTMAGLKETGTRPLLYGPASAFCQPFFLMTNAVVALTDLKFSMSRSSMPSSMTKIFSRNVIN